VAWERLEWVFAKTMRAEGERKAWCHVTIIEEFAEGVWRGTHEAL